MAETLRHNERLVCVGQTALRAPDGSFLPSVPLYIKVDEGAVSKKTGLSAGEEELNEDIAAVLAPMSKRYMDGVKALEGARA